MADDAIELATAYVSLLPSLSKFGPALERELGGLGVSAGNQFGKDFGRAVAKSAGPDLDRLQARLDATASAQADALGKVRVAQARLNEARQKGGQDSARALAAEENLAKATRDLERAQKEAKSATDAHEHGQQQLQNELKETSNKTDKVRRDTRDMGGQFGKAEKQAKDSGKGIKTAFSGFGKLFAPLLAIGIGAKIGSTLKEGVEQSSDLAEVQTKTNQIFGKEGVKALEQYSKGSAKNLGQTKVNVLDAASTFGVFGKSAGLGGKDLAKFSSGFVSLSSDLASFHNTSPEEAVEAIGAALRGESEPIRKYGILLDDASLRQEALRQGLVKTTKNALTPQQRVLAAHALILKQSKDAQGDFARTAGGFANQQRIAAAQTKELKGQLGSFLLPVLNTVLRFVNSKVIPGISDFITHIKDGTSVFSPFITVVGDLGGKLFDFFKNIAGGKAQLGGLGAGFLQVQSAGQQFKSAFMGIVGAVQGFYAVVKPIIVDIVDYIKLHWPEIQAVVGPIFGTIKDIVLDVMGIIQARIEQVTAVIGYIWSRWGDKIMAVVGATFKTIFGVISGVLKVISGIVRVVLGLMTGDMTKFKSGVKTIWDGIKQIVVSIVTGTFNQMKAIVGDRITAVRTSLGNWLTWLGSSFKSGVAKVYGWIKAPFDLAKKAIDTVIGNVRKALDRGVTGWGKVIDAFKAKAAAPINWVIDHVINGGLVAGYNKVADLVHLGHLGNFPRIEGYAEGGLIRGPRRGRDNLLGVAADGTPIARVEPDEFIMPRKKRRWFPFLEAIRTGRVQDLPPFKDGGFTGGLSFARRQVGKPYIFGSAGPRGFDCSGFIAAIQNVIEGKFPYHRRYSTPAFRGASAQGFRQNAKSPFMIGVNPSPGRFGHMAGTLLGVNVESAGGVGVRVGGHARGWTAPMFSWHGGYAGKGGGSIIGMLLGPAIRVFRALVNPLLDKAENAFDSPFGKAVGRFPRVLVDGMLKRFEKTDENDLDFAALGGFRNGTGPGGAAPGPRWVGEAGRELVTFAGGERVFSHGQSESMVAGGQTLQVNGNIGYDPREIFTEWQREARKARSRANLRRVVG